jgi:dephospho-CoA kinase
MSKGIVIAIGGVPGSGKTTLMRRFLALLVELGPVTPQKFGLVRYLRARPENGTPVNIFGVYGKKPIDTFEGTDKLSMSVQPDAVTAMEVCVTTGETVIFEGDRLYNNKFLQACRQTADTYILELQVDGAEQTQRCKARGSNQDEKWLKGRATKIANIRKANDVLLVPHNTPQEMERALHVILNTAGLEK